MHRHTGGSPRTRLFRTLFDRPAMTELIIHYAQYPLKTSTLRMRLGLVLVQFRCCPCLASFRQTSAGSSCSAFPGARLPAHPVCRSCTTADINLHSPVCQDKCSRVRTARRIPLFCSEQRAGECGPGIHCERGSAEAWALSRAT